VSDTHTRIKSLEEEDLAEGLDDDPAKGLAPGLGPEEERLGLAEGLVVLLPAQQLPAELKVGLVLRELAQPVGHGRLSAAVDHELVLRELPRQVLEQGQPLRSCIDASMKRKIVAIAIISHLQSSPMHGTRGRRPPARVGTF
jgi:hypothetical protein